MSRRGITHRTTVISSQGINILAMAQGTVL